MTIELTTPVLQDRTGFRASCLLMAVSWFAVFQPGWAPAVAGEGTHEATINLVSLIGKTVTIEKQSATEWLVTQQKVGGVTPADLPSGARKYDYNQAPTWLRIDNPHQEEKSISIELRWIEFRAMERREWGYLKRGTEYQVFKGNISPYTTHYTFKAPAGTSFFGPVPWYSNEDADRFLKLAAEKHPALCKVRVLGKSKEGREIKCLTIQSMVGFNQKRNVLVVGREHAMETSPSFAVEAVAKYLLGEGVPEKLLARYAFHLVLVANPDGVANGTKLPQPGPPRLYDLHYAGLSSNDPTAVAMRKETLSLIPVCYINYHSYLFPVPEIITYSKSDGLNMLETLVSDGPDGADTWYLKRQVHRGDTLLLYCHKHFNSVVALFELPWAGKQPAKIEQQAVKTFLSVMEAYDRRR